MLELMLIGMAVTLSLAWLGFLAFILLYAAGLITFYILMGLEALIRGLVRWIW